MENSQYSSDSNYKRDPRMYSQSRPHRYQNKPESYTRPPRAGGPKLNHDTNEEENGRQSWSQPRFSQNNKYIREGYNDKYQSYEADQNNARKGNIYVYPNSHQPSSNQSYQSNYYPRSKTQHFGVYQEFTTSFLPSPYLNN
ncbi:hypothetical protein HMI54_014033 [Coelomomyces lativittatus]|nr:hypothetical protein HMI54_014033 [Coelomomyces lativittatus]